MTDKERLEEVKNRFINGFGCLKYRRRRALNSDDESVKEQIKLLEGDIEWLIAQAERVQELEKANEKNYWIASDFKHENLKLEQQNKRYRATINAMRQILKDAIHSLDVGEKVQGLEYGVKMANEALESD